MAAASPLRSTAEDPEQQYRSSEPDTTRDEVDLVDWFRSLGYEVIDKRSKGGALWVVGHDRPLQDIMANLSGSRVSFTYAPNGGKATGRRSAWFTG